jgi:hypothetical protein
VLRIEHAPLADPLPTIVAGRASSKLSAGRRAAFGNWDGGRSRKTRPLMRVEGARVNRISAEGEVGDGPEPDELATSDRQ